MNKKLLNYLYGHANRHNSIAHCYKEAYMHCTFELPIYIYIQHNMNAFICYIGQLKL